jgi:dTDP-4-dehydrorhamnose 3,5-epimerase
LRAQVDLPVAISVRLARRPPRESPPAMLFHATDLADARLVETIPHRDERGSFARVFCAHEFSQAGLPTDFVQHSVSRNRLKGTLRGMHFQTAPHEEAKLVRCARGAILDVIIDLRPRSPTYRHWQGFELTEDNGRELYIPKGFAHGFQTLTDDAEIHYLISAYYEPGAGSGVRWDDPAFGIKWPLPISTMSEKDKGWALVG